MRSRLSSMRFFMIAHEMATRRGTTLLLVRKICARRHSLSILDLVIFSNELDREPRTGFLCLNVLPAGRLPAGRLSAGRLPAGRFPPNNLLCPLPKPSSCFPATVLLVILLFVDCFSAHKTQLSTALEIAPLIARGSFFFKKKIMEKSM